MKFNSFFEPMLLSEQAYPFDDDGYMFELKFDGIRALVHASPKNVRIFSRRGNDITSQYPELQNIRELVKDKTIFDGEIVSFESGKPSFSKLQNRNLLKDKTKIATMSKEEPVAFIAFDCLCKGSKDLTTTPLIERKKVLEEFLDTDFFIKTRYVFKDGKNLFQKVVKMRLEGIIAKRSDSLYEIGVRTKDWIKIKNYKKGTFVIGGLVDNKLKTSLLLGEWRGLDFKFVGKVSIMRDIPLYKNLKRIKGIKTSPFSDYEEKNVKYISPNISCEVAYIERTPSGHLRQPVFKKESEKKGRTSWKKS